MRTVGNTTSLVLSFAITTLLLAPSRAAEDKAIENVMKAVMKGDKSTYKVVTSGSGTDADAKKLLQYLKSLPGTTPPKGDLADWKARTTKLAQAATDLVAKKPGAIESLKKAGDCKGCHMAHRKLL